MAFDPDLYLAANGVGEGGGGFGGSAMPSPGFGQQVGETASAAGLGLMRGVPLANKAAGALMAAPAAFDPNPDRHFSDEYTGAERRINSAQEAAEQAHPIAYGAGKLGGEIAPLLIPGVGEAGLLAQGGILAGESLDQSRLGEDKAITAPAVARAGINAAASGALGMGTGYVAGKALNYAGPAVRKALSFMGPSAEAIDARIANPTAFANAPELPELAEKTVPKIANSFDDKIGDLVDKAGETLSTSKYLNDGAFPKDDILATVQKARGGMGGYSDDSAKAAKALDRVADRLKSAHGTVSQNQVHSIIKGIDADINWDNPAASATNEALVSVRRGLDAMLKEANPEYASLMKPASEAIQARDEFLKKMAVQNVRGEGYLPTDTTASRLGGSLKQGRVDSQRILDKVKEVTGEDLKTPLLAQQFREPTPEAPHGIPARVGGTIAGLGVTHGMGVPEQLLGGRMGHHMLADKLSGATRQGAGWIIDNVISNPAMAQYAPAFKEAAQRGEEAVVANHYVLMQRDPDYNQAFTQQLGHEPAMSY
jgi:hypothetical protein